MAESVLCPVSDPGEAAQHWRQSAVQSFRERAEQLGLAADPATSDLLAAVCTHSSALDNLWQRQQAAQEEVPWWADGEYDQARADRENDAGLQAHCAADHGTAFKHFTEAIRLAPTRAPYHANRAATALKLGQHATALQDARNALERDPCNEKAYMRAASALLALQQPHEAVHTYIACLSHLPGCKTAQAGLARAQLAAGAADAKHSQEQLQNECGARPGLSEAGMVEEAAATLLLTAEGMLQANPHSQPARCAHAEALLHCRRYKESEASAQRLPPGWDRQYLLAEGCWRRGDMAEALELLKAQQQVAAAPTKATRLHDRLTARHARLAEAEGALTDGVYQDAIEGCTALLQGCQPSACSGYYCRLLRCRAQAYLGRRLLQEAAADLTESLEWDASSVGTLMLRAEVFKEQGAHESSFLALQKAASLPGAPADLLLRLQEAAAACLQYGSSCGQGPASQAHRVLGVKAGARPSEVRSAFRQAARMWHPDKWATASRVEQDAAAATYDKLLKAFDSLSR